MLHRTRALTVLFGTLLSTALPAFAAQAAEQEERETTLESLQGEVDYLRSAMPGQAFAMTQVAYNFSNLWFAVEAENWPLAQFYLNETRGRLRWAMRVTPVRKVAGADMEITPIATALETTQLAALTEALAAKDHEAFRSGYQATLDACQGCHTTVEKPFLKLQIPKAPAEPLINFAP
jgi:hypothetical protein